jgi:hypothetical protein
MAGSPPADYELGRLTTSARLVVQAGAVMPWAPVPRQEHAPVVPGCGYQASD